MIRNILLKKVRVKTIFSFFEPIVVEPLELEYLKALCKSVGLKAYIEDQIFHKKSQMLENPDLIYLTGYNVAEEQILYEAKNYKKKYPDAKIIVGGVHVQLNASSFHKDCIDYVIHSHSFTAFKNVLDFINIGGDSAKGFDFQKNGKWIKGERLTLNYQEDLMPERSVFEKYKHKTHYLEKREVALVKGSVGCPYKCSYCYCKELNDEKYIRADYKQMAKEIEEIPAAYIWIVDDILFFDGQDCIDFIKEIKSLGVKKKYIVYLRADFILKHQNLIKDLKKIGLDELIIGFEAVTNKELKAYNKGTDSLDYLQVISFLKELHIDFTALFIIHPSYGLKDFKNLYGFIKQNKIEIFTISIFTPIKGTKDYKKEKDKLTTKNPEKFDFLHLVMKPRLPRPLFYTLFYGIHLRLLRTKRIRKFTWNLIRKDLWKTLSQ